MRQQLCYSEQRLPVFQRCRRRLIGRTAFDLRDLFRHIPEIARIVALSAQGHRAEIGAVGFNENAVHGADFQHLQGPARVFVGDRPVKAKIPASPEKLLCHLRGAGVTVKDPAQSVITAYDLQAVPVRLAVMDDHGQVKGQRELDLADKKGFLSLFMIGVPVIVKPDFPDRRAFRMPGKGSDLFQVPLLHFRQLLRVNSHRGIDMGETLRQRNCPPAAVYVASGIDDQFNPLSRQGRQQRLAVGIEGVVIIMGVGVKIHGDHFLFRSMV